MGPTEPGDADIVVMKRQLEKEDIVDNALHSFRKFFKDMKLNFMEVKQAVDEDVISKLKVPL